MNRFDIILGKKPPDSDWSKKLKGPYKKGSTGVRDYSVVSQKFMDNFSIRTSDSEALDRYGDSMGLRRYANETDNNFLDRLLRRVQFPHYYT